MSDPVRILGISGSLRAGSYNSAALRAAQALAPEGVQFEFAEIGDLPLYDDDQRHQAFPPAVLRLEQQIRSADAVLFASPEYNYSISGVLKNAIDWLSRLDHQPFAGKAAGIIGASGGLLGTARAQYHLRQIGVFLDLRFMNRPEVMIGGAQNRFDSSGTLTDAATREILAKFVAALRDWALAHRRQAPLKQ
jgi:chromate reductase